jgi:hypothetical protein
VKEYDLFVPLYYNDGRPVEPQKFQALQQQLLDQFGSLTFFPQPNEGFWTVAGITYRDAIVIDDVLTSDAQEARRFLSALKERLKEALQQEEILIVERDVENVVNTCDCLSDGCSGITSPAGGGSPAPKGFAPPSGLPWPCVRLTISGMGSKREVFTRDSSQLLHP